MRRSIISIVLAGACFAWTAVPVFAQGGGPSGGLGGGGTGPSGGLGGGAGGGGLGMGLGGSGLGGSSLGGSGLGGSGTGGTGGRGTGGSFTGGGFTGSTTFGGGTTSGQLGTTLGNVSYGTTSFLGRYYAEPLAIGAPNSSSTGSQYLRAFPTTLPTYGQPIYGNANLTTSNRTTGTTNPYGTALTTTASPYSGANTGGIRRAPAYIAQLSPDIDRLPRVSEPAMQNRLQGIIARSTRLPSRNGVSVSMEGSVVVLRGQVRDERERRLTEAAIRLEPGVREVRNLLTHPEKGTTSRP